MNARRTSAFVSGCFDLLHSGHVAFLQAAAEYGKLIVALGSDRTVFELKGRYPENSEQERAFMLRALSCVDRVVISRGSGYLDFEPELRELRPDVFIVNEDGSREDKAALCRALGVRYVALNRTPASGLTARSTTALRKQSKIPYRIDLAGGWLDQPFVSKLHPGPVIVTSLEPDHRFCERSGMATSTRKTAAWIWGSRLPDGDGETLGKIVFACENPPGKQEVSGSQDALGLTLPGLNRLHYDGEYWPSHIEPLRDEVTLDWLQSVIRLYPLQPRRQKYDVLGDTRLSRDGAKRLADAATACWDAVRALDVERLGAAITAGFEAQVSMFPRMVDAQIGGLVAEKRQEVAGLKLTGAGGGGYLVLVSEKAVPGTLPIRIRRGGLAPGHIRFEEAHTNRNFQGAWPEAA